MPNQLKHGEWVLYRTMTGTEAASDEITGAKVRGILNTHGYDSIRFGIRLVGGTNPTIDLGVWSAVSDFSVDLDSQAGLTTEGSFDVETFGTRVAAVVSAVTGDPDTVEIWVCPGARHGG